MTLIAIGEDTEGKERERRKGAGCSKEEDAFNERSWEVATQISVHTGDGRINLISV